ncbi:AMSH/STAMBP protein ubiquitin specific-protease [Malassezia nana]|uniref:AMSH/STAMBP protein ubiquitin specific-protease n=1 Tax=Malassezia nana TaxID=180528 RepID=A0AAF0EK10_9BASI|nr:AMSH/STAMBP protein ubiquitin specific-protease [Malassezia nana]
MAPKPVALQSNEQWLMRVNRDGLPICRDLHGLFTTAIISLCDRWPDWRYPLAFVLPALVQRLKALQFVQIVRDSANGMQNMLSLSQTKTSFTMNNETATKICHAFLDAGLLQRTDSAEEEVFAPSPKGLHLIDRFVTRHGIATRSVSNLLNLHTLCDKLLFLERDEQDDVLLSDAVVRIVFHRMVGLSPRRTESSALGMALQVTHARDSAGQMYETAHFASSDALNWLVHYTTLVSVDEAIVLAAHMVRLGWLEPETGLPPTRSNRVATVRVDASLRVDGAAYEGTFIEDETYHITERGATVAWKVDWVEQPTTMFATEQRPPTSFFQGRRKSVMRSVSPHLDEFEGYRSYVDASPPPTASPDLAPPARNDSVRSSRVTPARPSVPETVAHPAPPTYSLHDVLSHAPRRCAFASFLEERGDDAWLRLWCQIEWFRSDCRLATSGALKDVSCDDPIATLPAEVVRDVADQRPPGVDGPQMRTSLRGILVQSARTRFGPYVAEDSVLDKDVRAALAAAWQCYVNAEPLGDAMPSQQVARKSEKTLAKLLLQCSAAQKHAWAKLEGPLLAAWNAARTTRPGAR